MTSDFLSRLHTFALGNAESVKATTSPKRSIIRQEILFAMYFLYNPKAKDPKLLKLIYQLEQQGSTYALARKEYRAAIASSLCSSVIGRLRKEKRRQLRKLFDMYELAKQFYPAVVKHRPNARFFVPIRKKKSRQDKMLASVQQRTKSHAESMYGRRPKTATNEDSAWLRSFRDEERIKLLPDR